MRSDDVFVLGKSAYNKMQYLFWGAVAAGAFFGDSSFVQNLSSLPKLTCNLINPHLRTRIFFNYKKRYPSNQLLQ